MSRAATARLKTNPPVGRPPVLEWIAPDEMQVDEFYQRSLTNETAVALIRRIAQFWDWSLCQPINVARRADGSLWIVDGQHRHAAALMRGDIPHLPCVITSFADRGAEAAAFVALNKQRRALNGVDVFKAALVAGDQDAIAVMSIITDAGLTIAPHSNYISWQPGMLYCVPTIQAGFRKHGRTVVSSALIAFYAAELREQAFDPDAFLEGLGSASQQEWLRRARARALESGQNLRDATHTVLTMAYLNSLQETLEAA
jgi:hypothetical protein